VSGAEPTPALAALLRPHRDAIARRWVEAILATYPEQAAAVFGREQDRFANPVGHSVRTGVHGVVEALCDGMDEEQVRAGLREIIQVRAVQQFSPAQAVGFVFQLKGVVRRVLDGAGRPAVAPELAALDFVVDRLALAAFEVFTACREQVYQLRLEEAKRRVAWVVDRLNRSVGKEEQP
jgi:hypothetical protein